MPLDNFPDLLLLNGRVQTMDPAQPFAQAVAATGGKITYVGPADCAPCGPDTRVIDCAGRTVLPGFVESHLHLVLGGAELAHLQLGGVTGLAPVAARFHDYAVQHPDAPLLLAQGGDYDIFGKPTRRQDLDAIIADRPVAIMAADHHTVWANTMALREAGVLHGATMPHGHEVVLAADGTATGELREFEAFAPILALGGEAHLYLGISTGEDPSPWPTAEQFEQDIAKLRRGLGHCARHGITSAVNMDGNHYTLSLLEEAQSRDALTVRVKVPFHFKPHMKLADLDRATTMAARAQGDWVLSGFVKFFMDGVVDSRTAAMLRPYPDTDGHCADLLFSPDRFAEIATEVDRRGLQIAVHAIGDAAVRCTLDGIATARRTNGPNDLRHRIEHIELIDRADIGQFADLGVTASVQPVHAPGALDFPLEPTMTVIGWDRAADAYLCRDLAEAGARIAFASDWPVTDISVLRGIKAALTRPTYAGGTDQRLDLDATLYAYTAGGAYAAGMDHLTGTLKIGMAADIVVLSGDITTCPVNRIDELSISLTIAGGRITHQGTDI